PAIRSLTCEAIAPMSLLVLPRKIPPSRVTATITASSLSASCMSSGLLTLAISTVMPFCNMGVTTMKMISSTSMISAIEMTLGSDTTGAACGFLLVDDFMSFPPLGYGRLLLAAAAREEVVDQLHRGVVHFDVEGFDLVGEVVEGPHGRDGDKQTESGGDEGFGN